MEISKHSCKSVFQDGKDTPDPEHMIQIWAKLLNQMERTTAHIPLHDAEIDRR